jgi:peptidoglycan/LPS O-acetylase OafA/YrhL
MSRSPQPPLHALTSFRFLAAVAVFFHHVHAFKFNEGYCGVSFFYVLSGFILAYNYRFKFARFRPGDAWDFYAARLARIYPVHFLTLVAFLPLAWPGLRLDLSHSSRRLALNLTLTQSFSNSQANYWSYNFPAWSLSDEHFFYLLLPLILWLLTARRRKSVYSSALLLVSVWAGALGYAWLQHGSEHAFWRCYINPCFRICDFIVGVLLCNIYDQCQSGFRRLSLCQASLMEAASIVALSLAMIFAPRFPLSIRLGAYYTPFFALLILIFAFQGGYLSRLLTGRPLRMLGEISFSFYMFHVLCILYIEKYQAILKLGSFSRAGLEIIMGTTALTLAWICYFIYERPMRDRIRQWLFLSHRIMTRGRCLANFRGAVSAPGR